MDKSSPKGGKLKCHTCSIMTLFQVFHRRLTSGEVFNNSLLFSLLYSGNLCVCGGGGGRLGDQDLMKGDKVGKPCIVI